MVEANKRKTTDSKMPKVPCPISGHAEMEADSANKV